MPSTLDRELTITRLIPASPAKVYKAWTDPKLLKQWFAPLPYTTSKVEIDVRPGGRSMIMMRSPTGQDLPNHGVFLEVVPNKKLVFTDAYTEAWEPSEQPFMTVVLSFEEERGQTRYTARVLHWNSTDRESHEQMGFYQGWNKCTDQLVELVASI